MALAACVEVPFAAPDGAAAGDPAAPNPDWWLQVQENIRREEYRPTWQERDADGNAFPEPTPQFSNRSQGLRAYFGRDGVWYEPRARNGNWRVALRLEGLTRGGGNPNFAADETGDEPSHPPPSAASPGSPAHGLPSAAAPKAQKPRIDGHRIVYDRPWGREWYANREEGIEQAFEIAQRPDGTGTLRIVLAAEAPGHSVATPERVVFSTPERDVLEYGKLVVTDASGRPVPSRMEYVEEKLALAIEDDAAEYPLMVDPLSTAPHWTAESNQAIASFGYSVSSAGDVNGDGYGDVIVGAYQFDNGQADEGRAYVYHGSGTGLSTTANWTAESDLAGAWFGQSVSTAGDVNGDGYSDVIIGAPYLDNGQADEGRAYVYLGAGSGLASTPVWTAESDQANARFALSVSTAGDVNGDGYGDVIVGAVLFDNGQTDEGRVYVYHGSATGVTSVANWTAESNVEYVSFGNSVSTAGDVNGDGYGDVIVGAYTFSSGQLNEGRASVFHGSATGLSSVPNWAIESGQAGAYFGISVSNAGDVNGDGYGDVIVGARTFSNGQSGEGRAFVYHGSGTGLPATANWTCESDQANAQLGYSVSTAGDVNGDGYSDVVVGAPRFANGQSDEGRVYVYHGSGTGLSATANWTVESDQIGAELGRSVSEAGDVNGDGYGDIIAGAYRFDNSESNEGRAFVYSGSASGLANTSAWSADPADQLTTQFGRSLSIAGDVNGDGYLDVIVGARLWDGEAADEGRAYVYHGSATGLSPAASPDWIVDPTNQAGAHFGQCVSTAGDVNGDGYSDVIVGADGWDGEVADEGRAYLYYGSATGLSSSAGPNWTADPTDQAGAFFGTSVSTAGDVNGDGTSDVIVGADGWDGEAADEGRAYLYYGSATGLSSSAGPNWTADPADQAGASFGVSVSTAGDVNGDGASDVIVGAPLRDGAAADEGRAYVYHGGATGLSPGGSPDWTADPTDQADASFGVSVSSAGDVNGDGASDVIVGAFAWDGAAGGEGRAYVYHGGATGLSPAASPDWTADPTDQASAQFGQCVSTAGDVNGDGYSEVIVGADGWDGGAADEGRTYVYYGNGGPGLSLRPRQARADGTALRQLFGASGSTDSFRVRLLARSPSGRARVKLQWEVKPLGTLFDLAGLGESPSWIDIGTAGTEMDQLVTGLSANTAYHWRVRLKCSPHLEYGRWFSIGPNGWNETDVRTVNTPPAAPTAASQNRTTGGAGVVTGDSTSEGQIDLSATASDPDATDTFKLQFEVRVVGDAFTSPGTVSVDNAVFFESAFSASNAAQALTRTISGLADGALYHWQVRTLDGAGNASAWVGFGGNAENPPANPAATDFGADTTAPTAAVTADATTTNASPIAFTMTFSEPVTGLTAGEITVTNGTAGALSGGPIAYTIPVTPTLDGAVTCRVTAGAAQDAASNNSTVSNTASVTYDTIAPTVVVTPMGTTTGRSSFLFTMTFNEPVTGLTIGEITVTNGAAGALSGGPSVYTIPVTPTADGAVTCSVAAGAAEDAGGNANTSSNTASVMYDSLAPSVSGPDPDGDGDGNPESGAAPYTLTLAGAAPAAPGDIYEWDYDGDGVYDSISTTTSSTTVTYTIPGVYSPVLRITNTLLVASTSTVSITVAAPAGGEVPVISTWAASPDVGESGELIAFNGTASGGGTGTITLWEIDFEGDGTIDRSIAGPGPISTTFQYETPGTYNARLRVTDTENLGAEASISVTDPPSVSIVAPVLRVWFVSPRTGEVLWGNSITLHANAAPASIVESVVFKRWDTTVDGAADYTNLNDARWITIATATPPPSSFNVLWNASGVPADSFDLVCVAAGTGGVTASSDAVQTISVTVSANPAVWTIRETVSGNAKARTDAAPSGSDSQHRSLHPTLYESSTTVELPAGALAADTTLTISHLPGNPQGTASGFTFLPGEFQSITLGAGTLSKSATVTIQYPDADNDGIVNGQGVFEADLRIVRFDPILGAWRVIPECTVNTAENFVRGRTPGFSDFGVVGALAPVASGAGGGASDGDAAVAEVGRVESGDSSGGCFAARLGLESSSRVGLLALAICALGLGLWRAVDGSFRVR